MFLGSIPNEARKYTYEITSGWDVSEVYVGCSGNFTVERILAEVGDFDLHGCDVTIYSCSIGAYLAGDDLGVRLNPAFHDTFDWMLKGMETEAGRVATVLLASNFANGVTEDGRIKDHAYFERIIRGYQSQWDDLHRTTMEKIESVPFGLSSFTVGGAIEWILDIPTDVGVVSYPPFLVGVAGYEAMFKKLGWMFEWNEPTYRMFDDEGLEVYIDAIKERKEWLFSVPFEHTQSSEYLVGRMLTANRGVPLYVYASNAKSRIVVPNQDVAPLIVPRLGTDEELDGDIDLIPLSNGQFQEIRSRYLDVRIQVGQAGNAYGVTVGGKLVGVFALNDGALQGRPSDTAYLMCDFAVAPTKYKKLSKLILMTVLSDEAKLLAERMTRRRIRRIATTAFSDNPVSMKYRGVFELHKREEQNTETETHKYRLVYGADMGQHSMADGFEKWKAKHG